MKNKQIKKFANFFFYPKGNSLWSMWPWKFSSHKNKKLRESWAVLGQRENKKIEMKINTLICRPLPSFQHAAPCPLRQSNDGSSSVWWTLWWLPFCFRCCCSPFAISLPLDCHLPWVLAFARCKTDRTLQGPKRHKNKTKKWKAKWTRQGGVYAIKRKMGGKNE